MLDIFGEGNFYLELQDQGLEEEARILPDMKRLHAETGIPLLRPTTLIMCARKMRWHRIS